MFERLLSRLGIRRSEPAQVTKPKKPSLFSRIFKRQPQQTVPEEAPELPAWKKRQSGMEEAETKANQRAMWALQHATENPEDRIAQEAARQAIEYLQRRQKLAGDKRQYFNRQTIAQRLSENPLMTPEGQEATKKNRLDTFNANFGIDLDQDAYNKFYDITQTDSYKKMLEKHKEKYDVVVAMVADQIETAKDPKQMERSLDLMVRYDIPADIEIFTDMMDIVPDSFRSFEMELSEIYEEMVSDDDIERADVMRDLAYRYSHGRL